MLSEASVKVLRTVSELEEVRREWESWPGHRDSDIDFFSAVVSSNPATIRPHVIVLYRGGRPDGILIGRIDLTTLPLKIGYWHLPSPRLRLMTFVMGAQRGDCSSEASEILLREALDSLRRGEADLGRLDFVQVDSPLYRLARALVGVLRRDHVALSEPLWSMELSQTYEQVLKGLSQGLRYELKRKGRTIAASFKSLEVKCFHRAEELETALSDIEAIAAKSYQRRIGVGFHNTELTRELALFQAKKGWLRAYVLYLEAKPSAFSLGCLYHGVFYSDEMAFDPELTEYAPGTVLQARVLEDLCAQQARGFDFGPGDAEYKARFGTMRRDQTCLYLFPPTVRGVALNVLRTLTGVVNETGKALANRTGVLRRIKRILRGKKAATRKREVSKADRVGKVAVSKLAEQGQGTRGRAPRSDEREGVQSST